MSQKQARRNRQLNGFERPAKVATPVMERNSLILRRGQGNEMDQRPGTFVSPKKLTRILKRYDQHIPID